MFIELVNYQGMEVTVNVSHIVSVRKHTPNQTAIRLIGNDTADYYKHTYHDVLSALETVVGKDIQRV